MTPATSFTAAKARRRCDIRNLEAEAHVREVAAALRAHRSDVDALARERLADVAQQSLAIRGRHQDVHRISATRLTSPLRLDQPFRAALGQPLQARAVLAVHRDTLAARDETAHRVRRHRLAALGELRHEAVHPDDENAAVVRRFCFGFLFRLNFSPGNGNQTT